MITHEQKKITAESEKFPRLERFALRNHHLSQQIQRLKNYEKGFQKGMQIGALPYLMLYLHQCKVYVEGYEKMKGSKLGMVAIDAICHMIGQTEDLLGRGATMAEIAAWLHVSKPTAKRFIEKYCDGIDVIMVSWRGNHSVQYRYSLSVNKRSAYERQLFYASYKVYAAKLFADWLK